MPTYKVIVNRTSETQTPIKLTRGELVKCTEESDPNGDWAGWVYCVGMDKEGWVPKQIIEETHGQHFILEDYDATEFDLNLGEMLVSEKELNGWIWCRKVGQPGVTAWAPLNCLEKQL